MQPSAQSPTGFDAHGAWREALQQDGFAVLRGVLPQALVAALRAEYERTRATLKPGPPPPGEPFVLYWTHVRGMEEPRKAIRELPVLRDVVFRSDLSRAAGRILGGCPRLYETILFAKPPTISEVLHWHQDGSYFPVASRQILTAWIPFYSVTKDRGALHYVPGSHKKGPRGIVDLHTGLPCEGEDRPLIPADPAADGHPVVCCEVEPGDVILHDAYAWHMSGPNRVAGTDDRVALAIRYAADPMSYRPHPANEALSSRFAHLSLRPGDEIAYPEFPQIDACADTD